LIPIRFSNPIAGSSD